VREVVPTYDREVSFTRHLIGGSAPQKQINLAIVPSRKITKTSLF
jgi:hypothetical protein